MSDPSLRQSPLATLHLGSRVAHPAPNSEVQLVEKYAVGKINLRADPANAVLMQALAGSLGYELPREPNRTNGEGDCCALSLGPDEWLVTSPVGQEKALFEALSQAVAGHHVALNDVSDARIVLTLSGRRACAVLEKGCSLDLHPRAFQTGHCAQTRLARAAILLNRTGDTPAFDIHVAWSFAAYLWVWLEDAAAEFGLVVGGDS